MRQVLTALFLCFAILVGIVDSASGASTVHGPKTASGDFWENPNICTYKLGSLELEPCRGDTIVGYDSATGVLYYVRQNPWSSFDPLGLDDLPPQVRQMIMRQARIQAEAAYDDAMKNEPGWVKKGAEVLGIKSKFIKSLTEHQNHLLSNQASGKGDPTPTAEQKGLSILKALEKNFQKKPSEEPSEEPDLDGESGRDINEDNDDKGVSAPRKGEKTSHDRKKIVDSTPVKSEDNAKKTLKNNPSNLSQEELDDLDDQADNDTDQIEGVGAARREFVRKQREANENVEDGYEDAQDDQ